jgi:predicted RNase H-like HicB family nuclease
MFGKEMAMQKLTFSMRVPVAIRNEGKWFYSSCPVFDVHSQGTSEQEALSNLVEALQLFVETCYEQGSLEQVLREQGFAPGGDDAGDYGERTVEVPFSLIARRHAENRAH